MSLSGDGMAGSWQDGLGSWSLGSEWAEHWRFTGGGGSVEQIPAGGIDHLRLTVTNLERSRQFYAGLPGFGVAVESPPAGEPSAAGTFKILFGGIVMARGNLLMGLRPMAPPGHCFDPAGWALTISASASPVTMI
jgi:hypothetical protein